MERSIGITTGLGDGDAGGYSSDRMTSMFSKTMGNGILLVGDKFEIGGNGTATLTVGTGAAVNNGFFYESTTSVSLSMTGVANGTHYLVVRVNNTASTVTVLRSEGTGATTTTIAPYTCRLALVTSASYLATTDTLIAQVSLVSGFITSYTHIGRQQLALTEQVPTTVSALFAFVNTAVTTATLTQPLLSGSPSTTDARFISFTGTSGAVPGLSILEPGDYLWDVTLIWDTNTVGARGFKLLAPLEPSISGSTRYSEYQQFSPALTNVNPLLANTVVQRLTFVSKSPAGGTLANNCTMSLYQTSGTNRACSGTVRIIRL
jgi:hypothetical protein